MKFAHQFSGNDGTWFATTNALSLDSWAHVVVTYNSSSIANVPTFYVNGQPLTTTVDPDIPGGPTGTADPDAANDLLIGTNAAADRTFNGIIDEARYSGVIRSAEWIATEFNNQNTPSSFYTAGPLESFSVSPAGKTFNTALGAAGSTLTFDTGGQNAYWYADTTWPTGGDNGGIAAGAYALNMYFSELPRPWWNASYGYRQRVTVTAGSAAVPPGSRSSSTRLRKSKSPQ